MFAPKPKKPGVDVAIMVGKPKTGGPPPLDTPGKKPSPFGASAAPTDEESPAHEATESPAEEGAEDYGAKLTADIDNVFSEVGIDPTEGRQIASRLFSAVAKCLSGGSSGEGDQGLGEDGPPGRYGAA